MAGFVISSTTSTAAVLLAGRMSGWQRSVFGQNTIPSTVANIYNFNPTPRWKGVKGSYFHRVFSTDTEATLPMLVWLPMVTVTAALLEVDVALLAASGSVSSYPAVTVHPALLEVDVSLLPGAISIVYQPVTAHPALLEVDVSLIPATALSFSPLTAHAAILEIEVAMLLPGQVDAGAPPQTLTVGRLYPLPPGRRLYPVFPSGRNKLVG